MFSATAATFQMASPARPCCCGGHVETNITHCISVYFYGRVCMHVCVCTSFKWALLAVSEWCMYVYGGAPGKGGDIIVNSMYYDRPLFPGCHIS